MLTVGVQSQRNGRQERPVWRSAWREVGELLAQEHEQMMGRLDNIEDDVAVLKTDVAVLKTDVAVLKSDVAVLKSDVAVLKSDVVELKTDMVGIKGQLGRMERSNEAFQRRTDTRFERLITYIERDETKSS